MAFDNEIVLNDINLYINDREFLTLLGPSGCGKTTTLRLIAGFLTPTGGDVLFDGVRINDVPPHKRKVNTVFQRYALFPHLDVYENVAFGLRIAKLPEKEIDERVTEMLEIVSLRGFENRKVTQLSGGQQQRVAIARALVNRPKVLLLDEPLGALDLRLRKDMQQELKRIQQALGITFIYVTHDQEEALAMTYDSNESLYTKLKTGGSTYDIIIPSDYMIARLISEGMLEKLDFDKIPNYKYVDDAYKNTAYDPDNAYSVPYTWGTVGVIYNSRYVDEADIGSWDLLWNSKYSGKILMQWYSKWVVMIVESGSSAGCWTGQKSVTSMSCGTTTRPPGCCPVVRLTPTRPWARRFSSALVTVMFRSSRYFFT